MNTRTCKDCGEDKSVSNFTESGKICFKCKIIRADKADANRRQWRKEYEKSPKGKEAIRRATQRYARARRAAKGYPATPHPIGYYATRKLTEEQVLELRAKYKKGDGKIWAAKLGLSQPAIWGIVNYKSYKEIA